MSDSNGPQRKRSPALVFGKLAEKIEGLSVADAEEVLRRLRGEGAPVLFDEKKVGLVVAGVESFEQADRKRAMLEALVETLVPRPSDSTTSGRTLPHVGSLLSE